MLMHVCLLNISHNSWQDEMEIGRSSSVVSNRLTNHLYVLIMFENLLQKCLLQIFHFIQNKKTFWGGRYHITCPHDHSHQKLDTYMQAVNVFELACYIGQLRHIWQQNHNVVMGHTLIYTKKTHLSQPWSSGMTYLPPFIQACISNVNIEEYFRGGN